MKSTLYIYKLLAIILTTSYILNACNTKKNIQSKKKFFPVKAIIQTKAVNNFDDAADDPAIWYNYSNPSNSKIIGTDKQQGLGIYDLDGNLINFVSVGKINNCDVAYNIKTNKQTFDIVAGSNRTNNTISIYQLNNTNSSLDSIPIMSIPSITNEVYGFCLYQPTNSKETFAISVGKDGLIEQYKIASSNLLPKAELVWKYKLKSQCEGLVTDVEKQLLYVGEENVGVWKIDLNKNSNRQAELIINIKDNKNLKADIEGLALYYASNGKGYLIASSQGNNSFAIFERENPNKYIGSFQIIDGEKIDGVSETDGIEVLNLKLNETFKNGVFIAQDGFNYENNKLSTQNFKLISWEEIVKSIQPNLIIDNNYSQVKYK